MKRQLIWLFIVVGLAGCVDRIPVYAPRQTNSEAHRVAQAPQDCLDCHDLGTRPSHRATDDCRKCHKISKGY